MAISHLTGFIVTLQNLIETNTVIHRRLELLEFLQDALYELFVVLKISFDATKEMQDHTADLQRTADRLASLLTHYDQVTEDPVINLCTQKFRLGFLFYLLWLDFCTYAKLRARTSTPDLSLNVNCLNDRFTMFLVTTLQFLGFYASEQDFDMSLQDFLEHGESSE